MTFQDAANQLLGASHGNHSFFQAAVNHLGKTAVEEAIKAVMNGENAFGVLASLEEAMPEITN